MNTRATKGLAIASGSVLTRRYHTWLVPSQSKNGRQYTVDLSSDPPTCTCRDYADWQRECKHIFAAQYAVRRESGETLPEPEQTRQQTYRQEWHEYNLAATHEKSRFLELLFELCKGIDEPVQTFGRPRLSLADMLFCIVYKVYATISSRRFASDLRDALQKGFISQAPHFNSVLNYLDDERLTSLLRELITQSAMPLKAVEQDFAVDSSGFSTCHFVRWYSEKYGNGQKDAHDWLKLHAMVGVTTHVITSVEISDRDSHDTNYFKPLVTNTASRFNLREVSGDKAYANRANLKLVESVGAKPYITFRSNTRGDSTCATWNRIFHYYSLHREEYMRHYHKRSNSESAFSMVKARFGERLRSKTKTAQVNEVLCKVLAHNLCCVIQSIYELGSEPTFWNEA